MGNAESHNGWPEKLGPYPKEPLPPGQYYAVWSVGGRLKVVGRDPHVFTEPTTYWRLGNSIPIVVESVKVRRSTDGGQIFEAEAYQMITFKPHGEFAIFVKLQNGDYAMADVKDWEIVPDPDREVPFRIDWELVAETP